MPVYDGHGNIIEAKFPMKIYGDRNLLGYFVELYSECGKLSLQKCKEPIDHEFVGWLSMWYPELFDEYNRVIDGKLGYNELPKYELIEQG